VVLTGGSQKAFHDALRVYEVQMGALDHRYLEVWIDRLEIQTLWEKLLIEADAD
jgi:hypothetical protein